MARLAYFLRIGSVGVVFFFFIAIVVVIGTRPKVARMNVARCTFVCTDRDVVTNSTGGVVQPQPRQGVQSNEALMLQDKLSDYLSGDFSGNPIRKSVGLQERFLGRHPEWAKNPCAVSNAFAAVRFDIADFPIAIIELQTESREKELPMKVLTFIVEDFGNCVKEEEAYGLGKIMAWLEHESTRKRAIGESDEKERMDMEVAKSASIKHGYKSRIIATFTEEK